MDTIEKNFRDRPKNPIAARHYIKFLIESQRILEASFYCDLLIKEAPRNIEANKLAYLLAIKRMDRDVKTYDKNLWDRKAKREEILTLQLRYYYAFHDKKHVIHCANIIMDDEITSSDTMEIIIDSLIYANSYPLTKKFISLHSKKIKMEPVLEKDIKKILMSRLCQTLRRVHEDPNA